MILKITGKKEKVKEVEGEIEFDEVSFSYRGEEKKILNDLKLEDTKRRNSCICRRFWIRKDDDFESGNWFSESRQWSGTD